MDNHKKIEWFDYVEDIEAGGVIQEEIPPSQTSLNHMDDDIAVNREAVIAYKARLADQAQEIKVSKDSVLSNMINNVFLRNFDTIDNVLIVTGIYDPVARRTYV